MKKNRTVNLTLDEAYSRYVEESTGDPSESLVVTITLPTHRISPGYKQDSLNLKNLVSRAEKELHHVLNKKEAEVIVEKIKHAQQQIDHSHNLAGMVLYAGKEGCSVVKLPVVLQPEVSIGGYYDIRPLIQARQQVNNYYIITVSRQKIRLIEAVNDQALLEFDDENFPFDNTEYFTDSPIKLAQDDFTDRLIQEFFNQADKGFKYYLNESPLSVVLAGDVKNIPHYLEVMDNRCTYVGAIYGNHDTTPLHALVKETYPVILDYIHSEESECMAYIDNSASAGLLATDINEIFRLVKEGNINFLFLGKRFSLKGYPVEGFGNLESGEKENATDKDPVVDLVNLTVGNGGRVVFLDDDLLHAYSGVVLARKY